MIFGEPLIKDADFHEHSLHGVPVQVYFRGEHQEIGFIEAFCDNFVKINNAFYNRRYYTFLSRPGY